VAGIAQQLQVSAAVGAFLVGIALAGPLAHTARELLTPLRDLHAGRRTVASARTPRPSADVEQSKSMLARVSPSSVEIILQPSLSQQRRPGTGWSVQQHAMPAGRGRHPDRLPPTGWSGRGQGVSPACTRNLAALRSPSDQ